MNYVVKKPTKIGCYVQTTNCKTISAVKSKLGADVICNFQMFNVSTRKASYVLKVDGKILGNDGENYYGYAWNNNDRELTFTTASQMDNYDNFAGCICVVRDGKAITNPSYPSEIGGKRGRTCVGLKANGDIVIYCWKDGTSGACTMEKLGQKMVDLGCVNAVNYDGGGSTQLLCPDGGVTTSRTIYNFLYFMLDSESVSDSTDVVIEADECPYAEPTSNVQAGSTGEDAKWVQWYLNKNGASPALSVDGIFGSKSVNALKEFQEKAGLEMIDGICGPATRVALRVGGVGNNTPVSTPSPEVNSSKCPYTEPQSNIRFGARGEGVRWIQWHLNKHGSTLTIDGEYGSKTQNAVKNFQARKSLEVDGICGPVTRAALKSMKATTSDPISTSSDKKTLIKKREQMLDYIEKRVGDLYVYGAQGQLADSDIIDWSAKCFPGYTTAERASRMKKYAKAHKKNSRGEALRCYDCSGLFWAAENEITLDLANTNVDDSTADVLYNEYCVPIKKNELQPLDLVFNNDLTHVGIVGRNGKIYEAAGSDIGCVVNDGVEDRVVPSIYGTKYGCYAQYSKSAWTKYGRLKIYKDIPYEN